MSFSTPPDVPNLPGLTLNGLPQTVTSTMNSYTVVDATGAGWTITVNEDNRAGKGPVFAHTKLGSACSVRGRTSRPAVWSSPHADASVAVVVGVPAATPAGDYLSGIAVQSATAPAEYAAPLDLASRASSAPPSGPRSRPRDPVIRRCW